MANSNKKQATHRHFFRIIAILFGITLAFSWDFNTLYSVPSDRLTFGRHRSVQAIHKVANIDDIKNGKVVYIFGGSASYHMANEHRLSRLVSERLNEKVTVRIVGSEAQSLLESFGYIGSLKKGNNNKAYVMMSWSGLRMLPHSYGHVKAVIDQRRTLFYHHFLRDNVLFENSEMPLSLNYSGGEYRSYNEFLFNFDKNYTSNMGSRWLKYFISDKVRKIGSKRPFRFFLKDPQVFAPTEVFSDRRIDAIIKQFKNPKRREVIENNHSGYRAKLEERSGTLLAKDYYEEHLNFLKDIFDYSHKVAESSGYEFAALELPLYKGSYDTINAKTFRTDVLSEINHSALIHDYPSYHLGNDGSVEALDSIYGWWDSGHMSIYGEKYFEPFLVSVISAFINEEPSHDYELALSELQP